MSDNGNNGLPSRGLVPALRVFLGAGAVELRCVTLSANKLTIGRRPYNDLQLDDLTVSGEHALLSAREGEWAVHDLGSRNGTLVNGRPVRQQALADGDVVDIGIYRLRFEIARQAVAAGSEAAPLAAGSAAASVAGGSSEAAPRASAGDAGSLSAGSVPAPLDADPSAAPASVAAGSEPAPPAEPGTLPVAQIVYLSGTRTGSTQTLDRAINRIGGLAGQVAVVSRRKGSYYITHLEGLTFPQVNGELIGLTAHRLVDGDLIELAGTMLRFRL